jgi:hypothetical protein
MCNSKISLDKYTSSLTKGNDIFKYRSNLWDDR